MQAPGIDQAVLISGEHCGPLVLGATNVVFVPKLDGATRAFWMTDYGLLMMQRVIVDDSDVIRNGP